MDGSPELTDREVDALLEGATPDDRPDLQTLAELTAAVRSRAEAEPAPVMAYELRQAISARGARPALRSRRRWLDAVAAGAAVFAFGAVSAAGALPAPLQNAVADAGGAVGVALPRADDAAPDDAPGIEMAAVALGEPEDEGTEPKSAAPPSVTPGGAMPADPGVPGDEEPATPATPPAPAEAQGIGGPGAPADHAPAPDGVGRPDTAKGPKPNRSPQLDDEQPPTGPEDGSEEQQQDDDDDDDGSDADVHRELLTG